MEKYLYRFYYEYSNGLKFEMGVGSYKYPTRSKYYKKLKEMFNLTFIDSYGYERVYSQFDDCYFLYDKGNRQILRLEKSGDIATFDNKLYAIEDCRGNECVLNFYELPIKFQKEMVEQINKYE